MAYAAYKAMGFPTPVDDGTGRIDIQVLDLSPWHVTAGICYGGFNFDVGTIGAFDEAYATGEDVFAEVQYNLFVPQFWDDYWIYQQSQAWASNAALGFPATSQLGPFDMSLDCYPTNGVSNNCSTNDFENRGDSRWPFWEYLSERFGVTFISEVLRDAADRQRFDDRPADGPRRARHDARCRVQRIRHEDDGRRLDAPRRSTCATPPISGTPIMTGVATGDLPAQTFNVNHLATRYVEIDRGDGAADHPCFAATLTITVQIPAGVTSQPSFYWNGGGGSAVDLAVSGNTATTTVPWDTCMWASKGLSVAAQCDDRQGRDDVHRLGAPHGRQEHARQREGAARSVDTVRHRSSTSRRPTRRRRSRSSALSS